MLSDYPSQDFRFVPSGHYHNRPSSKIIRRRAAIKKDSGLGQLCPSCGMTRSKMNKCECNS